MHTSDMLLERSMSHTHTSVPVRTLAPESHSEFLFPLDKEKVDSSSAAELVSSASRRDRTISSIPLPTDRSLSAAQKSVARRRGLSWVNKLQLCNCVVCSQTREGDTTQSSPLRTGSDCGFGRLNGTALVTSQSVCPHMRLVNPTASDIAFIALLMRPQQNSLYGTASNVRAYSSPPLAVGVRGRRGFIRPALAPSNDGPTQSRECLLGILLGELSLHESSCFNNKKSFITNFLPELYEIAADAIDGAATPAHGDALSPSSSNPASTLRVLIRGFAIVCIVLAAQYSAAMTGGDSDRDGEKKSTKAPVRRRWDLKGAGLAAYKAAYQNASRTSRYDFTTMALDGQLPEDDGIPTDNSVKEYANLGFALLDGLTDDAYDSVIAFFDTATDNYSGHTLWQHLTGAGSDETALQQKFADIAALLLEWLSHPVLVPRDAFIVPDVSVAHSA